jgi:regulator of protease activity HflC (stomatin/prohibitin superfamily)
MTEFVSNNSEALAAAVGVAAILLVFWLLASRTKLTVFEWQTALLYDDGVFKRTLGPGKYRFFVPPASWIVFDRRPQFLTVPLQEVLSRDAQGFKIALVAEYQIDEPAKLMRAFVVSSQADVRAALAPVLQLTVRDAAGTYTLDEILQTRDALPTLVRAAAVERLANAGITLLKVAASEIAIAPELRTIYAASVAQRKTVVQREPRRDDVEVRELTPADPPYGPDDDLL